MENKMNPNQKHDSELRVFHGGEKLFVVFYPIASFEWASFRCVYCGTGNTFGMKNWGKALFRYRGNFHTFFEPDLEKHNFLPEDFNLEFMCPNCKMLYRAFAKS